jgi:prepilin-type N-terminal cleavage/methylation domain-containing protein
MPRRRTNGFTLIEMLTVMVIAAIVIGLTIPAVTRLMSSGGVSAASREVANALSLARQYAITHRATTRVVFPYFVTTGAGTNAAPLYQSYAVLEVLPMTNYISKWETLPLGAVFMSKNTTITGAPFFPLDGLSAASLSFPNTNLGNNATLAYIEFSPTGAVTPSTSGGGSTLTITEGFVNNYGTVTPTSITNNGVGSVLANSASISVDVMVGRIQVMRP